MKTGFDNDKYIKMQSEKILERVNKFDNKLYLEFGGKLFDDYHAARVLPGFKYDAKISLLKSLKDKVEVIFCISAKDIEKNKIRADFGITYDLDVLRLIDNLRSVGIQVNSVVITLFSGQFSAETFRKKLERRNIKTYIHTYTKGYPMDVDTIVSEEGYGANPYIETTKPLVVVSAPGPGSGKLGTCLSQLYHEHKRGVHAGYAKFETFPVWNMPLKHPVNMAYEAATADLKDVNMIDPFQLEKYGQTTVNYNRDIEVFPVVKNILKKIIGEDLYFSPTDMGVNMIGYCAKDDEIVREASKQEIIRRYYKCLCEYKQGLVEKDIPERVKMLMDELVLSVDDRTVVKPALEKARKEGVPAMAIQLENGKIIVGKTTDIMTAPASAVLNALKDLSRIDDEVKLLAPIVIDPMIKLKKELSGKDEKLDLQDVLQALAICAVTNPVLDKPLSKLKELRCTESHTSHFISKIDETMLRNLKMNLTSEAEYYTQKLYFN